MEEINNRVLSSIKKTLQVMPSLKKPSQSPSIICQHQRLTPQKNQKILNISKNLVNKKKEEIDRSRSKKMRREKEIVCSNENKSPNLKRPVWSPWGCSVTPSSRVRLSPPGEKLNKYANILEDQELVLKIKDRWANQLKKDLFKEKYQARVESARRKAFKKTQNENDWIKNLRKHDVNCSWCSRSASKSKSPKKSQSCSRSCSHKKLKSVSASKKKPSPINKQNSKLSLLQKMR